MGYMSINKTQLDRRVKLNLELYMKVGKESIRVYDLFSSSYSSLLGCFLFQPSCSTRSTREVKLGVVHEGWKRKHPSSEEYELRNKSYWYSLEDGENFWELFSRYVYSEYSITEDTP